jgi:ribosomal protein S27E
VRLDDLKLTGLRDASLKEEKGRQFACPNCGAQVAVTLATSKSITCKSCDSIIDLQTGMGAELRHAIQDEPVALLIPLGTMGQMQGVSWQVVGFQHRMGAALVHDGGEDEQFGWSEYLLYNQKRGFTFLVDAEEGWSLVKPTTGAPTYKAGSQSALYLGNQYKLLSSYIAETNYVAGEFYWQVVRGQKTSNIDFANGRAMLSREQTPTEITWSSGSKLDGGAVAAAFKFDSKKDLFKRTDAQPLSAASGMSVLTIVIVFVAILVLLMLFSRCSSCNPNVENCSSSSSSRTSGGSFGGSSGGGGHK